MKKLALVLPLLLAGCSTTTPDSTGIVASTAIWADVAEAVTGQEVEAIVDDSNLDPHSFEPTASDMATAQAAELLIVNGGGYDQWLYNTIEHDNLIAAMELKHHHANEHVWYDTDAIARVAQEIAEATGTDASALDADLAALREAIAGLPEITVAQTHTIADYLIDDSPMVDLTPEGYRQTQLGHGEPAAADVAEFLALIESGKVDLLIDNPQTQNDLSNRLRSAAEKAGIPIVQIGETPPDGTDFLDYFQQVVQQLNDAALS